MEQALPLLPPSTNDQYRGSPLPVWFLGLCALLTLAPAALHSFLPDGGSQVVAGLDLGDRRDLVVGAFAWEGATQFALGLGLLAAAVRYRSFTAFCLVLVAIERTLMSLQAWVLRPPAGGHHPPEHYGSPVFAMLALAFAWLAMRPRRDSAEA